MKNRARDLSSGVSSISRSCPGNVPGLCATTWSELAGLVHIAPREGLDAAGPLFFVRRVTLRCKEIQKKVEIINSIFMRFQSG